METEEVVEIENNEEPKVDEAELLELAKNEGLVDQTPEEEEVETGKPLTISEEEQAQIMASMETILFMSDKPVSLPKLRSTINPDVPLSAYRTLMARLREDFARDSRGIEIGELALGFQLRTKPHMAAVLRKMIKTQPLRLSAATMEVLAVIAYKQPVTKDEVDSIRGVDSGYVLRNLMEKRLVKIAGRSELPGKPMVYGTTHEFLELFNMKDTNALPPLHEVESMVAASEVGFEEKAQAVMDEFGKMVQNNTKVLFDDSQIDTELESLRSEIASIPTSTRFIDESKQKEKLKERLDELAAQGLTLNAEGLEVPIGSEGALAADEIMARKDAEIRELILGEQTEIADEIPVTVTTTAVVADSEVAIQVATAITEHQPSPELEAAAADAQWERHAAMIAEAVGEAQAAELDAEVAVVNAEVIADAVVEAKIEQALHEEREEKEPEAEI